MMIRTIGLIVTLAVGVLAAPLPTEAQQAGKIHRIGFLSTGIAARDKSLLAAFKQGLKELGYVEGKNIVIEQRYGKRHQRPALAAELVRLKVDIIVTGGGDVAYAKKASSTMPIVMTYSANPVRQGLVASLAHPGGNVTGLSDFHGDLVTKRLELLKEVIPLVSRVAVLFNPNSGGSRRMLKDVQAVAPALGVTVLPLEFKGPDDVDHAFATIRKERAGGLLQSVGLGRHRRRIVDLAAKSRLPAIYTQGRWVAAGGLMSYGASWLDLFRRAATYVDKILKGAKPADLPVEQPKKFELIINLKSAKMMGLTIPPSILYRADKVIK
ncbi:MAG: ABC transporter substrate-binding protein [Deltaproteobacteria bacterium]|nr:ABC transporter substrate-binding protein [Deltaproteobacteria bacterium]